MKQQKLTGYRPAYPRKAWRDAALTAAALVAMGGMTGCVKEKATGLQTVGMVAVPEPTEQTLVLDGEVAIETPEPTKEPALQGKILVTEPPEEVLVTDGEVAIPEPTEEELVLDGEEMIEEPENTPEAPLRTTGVLLMPTSTPEA